MRVLLIAVDVAVKVQLLTREGGLPAALTVDAIVRLLMGSVANDLSRPPQIRAQLLRDISLDQLPGTAANIGSYSDRDPQTRFVWALQRVLDGVEIDPAQSHG